MIDSQIIFLPVTDLERASDFYTVTLGLELVVDQGRCRIFRTMDAAFVGICTDAPAASDGVIVTLVTDDVEGWCERIVTSGYPLESGPTHSDVYKITHAFLRDPDGNRIEIQRFDDASWAG